MFCCTVLNIAMEKVSFPRRALLNALIMLIGLVGLVLALEKSFPVVVISIILVGFSSSFGER
jgi:predicted MFS family arabinose efflux permease